MGGLFSAFDPAHSPFGVGGFGPEKVFELAPGIWISRTVTTTWLIMAVLFLFSYLASRNLKKNPDGVQVMVETFVDAIYGLVKQTMGERRMAFAPYMGMLILFIGAANMSILVGLRPPTADLNTTLALSGLTFLMIHGFGLKYAGTGHLKAFISPHPLFLPLHLVGECAVPISMGFRLFGNIAGGLIIMDLLYDTIIYKLQLVGIPILAFVPFPAFMHMYFDLFIALLQAFIFTMLTMVFISVAADEGH